MKTQTAASIGFWAMIAVGVLLLVLIFAVPYFADLVLMMSSGEEALARPLQVLFNLSRYSVHHGIVFGTAYIVLLVPVAYWYASTKPPKKLLILKKQNSKQ
jgi:hypothetical protein